MSDTEHVTTHFITENDCCVFKTGDKHKKLAGNTTNRRKRINSSEV